MLGSTGCSTRTALLGSILAELTTARIDRWNLPRRPRPRYTAVPKAQLSPWVLGCRAICPGREIAGTATDVDDLGQVLIDTGGQAVAVWAGDLTHLRSTPVRRAATVRRTARRVGVPIRTACAGHAGVRVVGRNIDPRYVSTFCLLP